MYLPSVYHTGHSSRSPICLIRQLCIGVCMSHVRATEGKVQPCERCTEVLLYTAISTSIIPHLGCNSTVMFARVGVDVTPQWVLFCPSHDLPLSDVTATLLTRDVQTSVGDKCLKIPHMKQQL